MKLSVKVHVEPLNVKVSFVRLWNTCNSPFFTSSLNFWVKVSLKLLEPSLNVTENVEVELPLKIAFPLGVSVVWNWPEALEQTVTSTKVEQVSGKSKC